MEKKIWSVIVVILLLNVVDLMYTHYFFSIGVQEANPVLEYIRTQYTFPVFVVVKMSIIGFALTILVWAMGRIKNLRQYYLWCFSVGFALVFYSGVCVMHVVAFFYLS
jgi:hypothetical protein